MAVDCGKLQHDRLNVSRLGAHGIVRTIQKKVKHPRCDLVDDSPDLVDLLTKYRACVDSEGRPAGPRKPLDLISHSATDDHLLALGPSFLIDPSSAGVFRDLKDALTTINVKEVRLLGCFTGSTARGLQTIDALQAAIDPMLVEGIDGYLYADDFNDEGFQSTGKIVASHPTIDESGELPPLPETAPPITQVDPRAGFEFDEAQESEGAYWPRREFLIGTDLSPFYRLIQASVLRPGRDLPGLLTVPAVQYRIPSPDHPGRFHLLQVLFNWRALQLYPPHDDVDPFAHAHVFLLPKDRREELKKTFEASSVRLPATTH
ncbi:MAG TPA: hypothetical protein VKE22_23135 [Haliangiales bacterium]|nr:hypothetical protein [Haliangiales bacterium]